MTTTLIKAKAIANTHVKTRPKMIAEKYSARIKRIILTSVPQIDDGAGRYVFNTNTPYSLRLTYFDLCV